MGSKKLFCLALLAVAVPAGAQAEVLTGLLSGNRLASFDSMNGQQIGSIVGISGLAAGETLVGIDYRPANGMLYGVGTTSVIYSIDAKTGAATATGPAGAYALAGSSFGVDFNPVPDRLRVVSDSEQNLRLNPNDNGLGGNDGALAYDNTADDGDAVDANAGANPNVIAAAYTNSAFGPAPATTTLYVIDSGLDVLAIQAPPNAGVLNTVGSLGIDASGEVGFDISGLTGIAYLTSGDALYRLSLGTGDASFVGAFGIDGVLDIAAAQVPAPGAFALFGLAAAALLGARRRRSA